jgi:hypothetical protein
MIQKVFFGNTNTLTASATDIRVNEKNGLECDRIIDFYFRRLPATFIKYNRWIYRFHFERS